MPISCIYGLPGRNKTHFSVFYAISIANKFKKSLVANFLFHPDNLIEYCSYMGYSWLLERFASQEPTVYFCPMETKEDIGNLLSIPNSVIICDEAAGYFPARGSTHNTPVQFLKDITQVRHRKQYFLAITQSENLLDSAIRSLADEIIYCNGISFYDEKLAAPRLIYKVVRRFTPDKFASWFSNPRLRGNPIKTKMMANKSWAGQLSWADKFLFKVYPSFYLVHEQSRMIAENSYFPDSKIRYISPVCHAVSVRARRFSLDDLDNPELQTSSMQSSLPSIPFMMPSEVVFPVKSSLHRWLFLNLPAEFLPIGAKIYALYLHYFSSKFFKLNLTNRLHKIVLCLSISAIFFVFADILSLICFCLRFISSVLFSH